METIWQIKIYLLGLLECKIKYKCLIKITPYNNNANNKYNTLNKILDGSSNELHILW